MTDVNLTILKAVSSANVGVNDRFTYTITVSNDGSTVAHNVHVTDSLNKALTYISNTVTEGDLSYSQGVIGWKIDSLSPNEQAILTLTVFATTSGTIANTATVAGDEPDVNPANNTSTVDKDILQFKIPNVITPNGDNKNDVFKIDGLALYQDNQLIIWNRWNS